jgi:flagellar biosynthesis component FlhA
MGNLRVLTLNPELEESLREALQETELGNYLALNPDLNNSFVYAVNEENRRICQYGISCNIASCPRA